MIKFFRKATLTPMIQFTDYNMDEIFDFTKGAFNVSDNTISTSEGIMNVTVGDWVAQDSSGNFYPIKDDVKQKSYQLVEQQMIQQIKLTESNQIVIESYIKSVIEDIIQVYPKCKIRYRYIDSIDTYEFFYSNKKYINNSEFEALFYSVASKYLYDNGIKNYCFNYRYTSK